MGPGKAGPNAETCVDTQRVYRAFASPSWYWTRLTQTIIAWCRERGFEWIYLHASNQGRPLYESLGFVPSSEMRLKL
jgi:hypothetical protein